MLMVMLPVDLLLEEGVVEAAPALPVPLTTPLIGLGPGPVPAPGAAPEPAPEPAPGLGLGPAESKLPCGLPW